MSASRAAAPRTPQIPVPPLALLRATRLVEGLAGTDPLDGAALRAALRRGPARNPVAAARLLAAIRAALPGARVAAGLQSTLLADGWSGRHLLTAFGGEAPGLSLRRLLVLAGKRLDHRATARVLEAAPHALARFLQRSGRDEAALLAALAEAAAHAGPVLLAALSRPALPRLRAGTTPILLPAGEGAFLGYLRLLPGPRTPLPHLEAGTWVHAFDLADPQRLLREAIRAGAGPAALTPFLALLAPNAGGDSRQGGGLALAPWAGDVMDEIRLLATPPALAARLEAGECPDALSRELRELR